MPYLLKHARMLIGDPPEQWQGDLLIEDDRVKRIGDALSLSDTPNAIVIDCLNYLITPGFVNAHIHPNQLLNRGFLEGLGTDDLLAGMHGRHESKSDDDRYWASLVSIGEALRCGTTYFSAFVSDPGRIGDALCDSGVRGTVTAAPKDQWLGHGTAEVRDTERMLGRLREHAQSALSARVSSSIGAVSEKGASAKLLQGIARIAADTSTRVYMHVAEGKSAVEVSRRLHGADPIEFLDVIGFLGPHVCLVHASRITTSEIDRLARSRTNVCHCPISNAKTAAGVLPLQRLIDSGIRVALGTDAASTGNTNNILVEGYFCALLHRAITDTSLSPTAHLIYKMLTTLGAAAVGLEHEIGRIEVGYKADLVIWDLRQSAFLSNLSDPVTTLVFAGSEVRASRVFVDGVLVYEENPVMFDMQEAVANVSAYATRLSQ